ncbi:MAG: beta-ketoacyl-ACP synthase [Rhodospirillaceae bacterium]|nr:beta-ketoacyl-ACP synthase [Rhodospirillaceae bacterium]
MPSREIWVTGCGLVSALGEGEEQHWQGLNDPGRSAAVVDRQSFAPFIVYPMAPLDLDRHIPRKGDQRAMGPLMHYGVYAAGMALAAAGLAGDPALLGATHLVAAAGGGERDMELDEQILTALQDEPQAAVRLNQRLTDGLRPTLFLAQLPNLFAGNISIVHGVSGSSRTFMGEEQAGVDAVRIAAERIAAGQGDLFLVGSAFNASRPDQLLTYQSAGLLMTGPLIGLWRRPKAGMCPGSVGAFLVLEARGHAEARGAAPLARLVRVLADRCRREPGMAATNAAAQWRSLGVSEGPLVVISGASGAGPATAEERDLLADLVRRRPGIAVRGTAMAIGHAVEAAFPANLILAISCLRRRAVFAPLSPEEGLEAPSPDAPVRQAVVTGWGHHRGEGMALLEEVE